MEKVQVKMMEQKALAKRIDSKMYVPQIILLLIAFVLGVFMPDKVVSLISATMLGF